MKLKQNRQSKVKTKLKPKIKTHYIAFVAASIDGRISIDQNKSPDWTSKEDWKFFQNKLKSVDAIVAGRNTYLAAQKHINKRVAYIFSSKVQEPEKEGTVTFINPAITNLKKIFSQYKNIGIVGGGQVYHTMLIKGLLDELYLTIEPIVFGQGIPMFQDEKKSQAKKIMFNLKSIRTLNKAGTILLHYQIVEK